METVGDGAMRVARVRSKDGTSIAYEMKGRGPTLILVDGALAHRTYRGGLPLAAALARDFSVIAYDRRGRGESGDGPAYAVEREIEDLEALIDAAGAPAHVYGFSSGAVLALRAAAALHGKVRKLAVLEPPFNGDDDASKREFAEFRAQLLERVRTDRRNDAVEFFLSGMLPPEVLDDMKQTPEWRAMTAVAHTLGYDVEVMGEDGAVPLRSAAAVCVPVLVLAGGESPAFKHEAADALAGALPNAQRKTLAGQMTLVPPEVLAPILTEFFRA